MNIYVKSVPTLIGDFLGCLPALQHLSKDNNVYIEHKQECEKLYELIPPEYSIFPIEFKNNPINYIIDISKAFDNAHKNNWYMSQAFFNELNLPVPVIAPKANIEYNYIKHNDLYFISPFARSLPPNQKWSKENWLTFIDMHPEKEFFILGNTKYDPLKFITAKNVHDYYDHSLKNVASMMKSSNGLISVITGTSHLAFHLGVKNIVLNNQNMSWGRNPDGIHIETSIQNLKPAELNKYV
jgi:hypothetical protein